MCPERRKKPQSHALAAACLAARPDAYRCSFHPVTQSNRNLLDFVSRSC